jgi:hypothetical protein
VAALPLPGGRHRLILDLTQEIAERDETEMSLDQFRAVVHARVPGALRVRDPTWVAKLRIHRREPRPDRDQMTWSLHGSAGPKQQDDHRSGEWTAEVLY